ncbi:hypothetical protein HGRIS_000851 [Hohenbuehelia grisea]|uniref:Uncharacterized protein n=1 Tax=Hohenbuehelia grisea TaxID=104357 RepID=A0ABR3IPY6_9AGAR
MAFSTILPFAYEHKASATTSSRKLLTAALVTFVSVVTLASVLPFSSSSASAPLSRSRIYPVRAATAAADFEFTAEQELAAVTSFVTAVASNALPASVDASAPIDPQLVLEFGISGDAQSELEEMQQDVWNLNPVVLYGQKHSAASRSVKATLSSLNLSPPPTFVDVDTREDASIVSAIVTRVTGATEFPILLVGGKVIATDDLEALQAFGELKTILAAAGATVDGSKKVKVHERKQIKVTRTDSGVVLEGQKRELTQEELVFRGFITL